MNNPPPRVYIDEELDAVHYAIRNNTLFYHICFLSNGNFGLISAAGMPYGQVSDINEIPDLYAKKRKAEIELEEVREAARLAKTQFKITDLEIKI